MRLSQMAPTTDRVLHTRLATTNTSSDRSLTFAIGVGYSDCYDKFVSQFGTRTTFTTKTRNLLSPFCPHVLTIILDRTKEQMVRANTSPVIAVMANTEPGGDRPKMQLPRDAMSFNGFAAGPIGAGCSITVNEIPCPNPTGVGLVNVFPESFSQWPLLVRRSDDTQSVELNEALAGANRLTTTALTEGAENGRIILHDYPPTQDYYAVPRGVTSTAGAFARPDYPIKEQVRQWLFERVKARKPRQQRIAGGRVR